MESEKKTWECEHDNQGFKKTQTPAICDQAGHAG